MLPEWKATVSAVTAGISESQRHSSEAHRSEGEDRCQVEVMHRVKFAVIPPGFLMLTEKWRVNSVLQGCKNVYSHNKRHVLYLKKCPSYGVTCLMRQNWKNKEGQTDEGRQQDSVFFKQLDVM